MIEKTRRSRRSRELRRRGLALLLSLTMCVGMLSFDTFAMEGETFDNAVTAEETVIEADEIEVEVDEPEEAKAEADGSETDGTEVGEPEADGSEVDRSEAEGAEADGAEADEPGTDGSEVDEPEADGSEADEPDADGSEVDEPDADGSEADEPDADGSETDEPESEVDGSVFEDDKPAVDEPVVGDDDPTVEAPAEETVAGEVPAEVETTVQKEIPAEVQDFLDAVAAIPADINADNVEEAGDLVNAALDAYEVLIGAGLDGYEGVEEAMETVYAAYEAVEEVQNTQSTNYVSLDDIHIETYIGYDEKMSNYDAGTITKWVGGSLPYNYCPFEPIQCRRCGKVLVNMIPAYYAFPNPWHAEDLNASDDGIIEYTGRKKAWYPLDDQYAGMQFDYEAKKPGTVTAELIVAHGFRQKYQRCSCGGSGYNASYYYGYNPYWYQRYISFNVTVNARYQLNYDTDGGSVVAPTIKDVAETTTTLNVTSTVPTKDGYTFKGWKDESGNTVSGSVTLDWEEGKGSKDDPVEKILYAVWEKDAITGPADTTYLVLCEYYVDGEMIACCEGAPIKAKVGDVIEGAPLVEGNPGWDKYTVDEKEIEFDYVGSYKGSYEVKGNGKKFTCGDKAPSITLVTKVTENVIILRYEKNMSRNKKVTLVKEFIDQAGNKIELKDVEGFSLQYSYIYGGKTTSGTLEYKDAKDTRENSGRPTLTWDLDVPVDNDASSTKTTPLTITEDGYYLDGPTWVKQEGLNTSNGKAVTGTYQIDATTNSDTRSIKNYYEKDREPGKDEADYKVEWYDADTDKLLPKDVKASNPETRKGEVGKEVSVTDADKSIEGYTFKADDNRNKLSDYLAESGTVLKLYFTKDSGKTEETTADYTVEWYDATTGEKLPAEVTPGKENPETRKGEMGKKVSVTEADKTISGYTFKADDDRNVLSDTLNDKLDIVLKLYFTKDPGKTEETTADYTVEWYDATTGEKLPAEVTPDKENPETRNGEVDEEVSVTEADKTISGYTFKADDSRNKLSDTLAESGTVLKLYFTKDLKATSYKVVHEYWTNGVRNMNLTVTEEGKTGNVGDKISAADIEKRPTAGGDTYTYTSASAEELELTDSDTANVIILRYDRTVAGTVTETDTPSDGGSPSRGSSTSVPRSVTSIPDETVPLVDIPDALLPLSDGPVEDTIFTSILDEDVPLVGIPKTGDDSQNWMWMLSALLSGFGIAWLSLKRKHEDGEG